MALTLRITGDNLNLAVDLDGYEQLIQPGQSIQLRGLDIDHHVDGDIQITRATVARSGVTQTISGSVAGTVNQIGNAGTVNL